jgi:fused signal recognition particle receptor
MFELFTKAINSFFRPLTHAFTELFTTKTFDEHTIKLLEQALLKADTGLPTTREFIAHIKKSALTSSRGDDLKGVLKNHLTQLLRSVTVHPQAHVYCMVGINGAGKTTTAAKLAYHFHQAGKKVLLVAADTFRAAAIEQLSLWAQQYTLPLIAGKQGQDPSSVLFTAIETYKNEMYDILIIDTAGRLPTHHNLMAELSKMRRVLDRHLPEKKVATLLTIDTLLGQNSLEQARLFKQHIPIDGTILTKIDSGCKGGIVCALAYEQSLPLSYVSFGEKINDLAPFETQLFVNALLHD